MLGEDSCWGHGLTLYQPVIQIPRLIRAPTVKAESESRPTQLLDLAPTMIDRVLLDRHPR